MILTNPCWIASSHPSESISTFRSWNEFEPAAITLKTCTRIDRNESGAKSSIREKTQSSLARYGRGYYCDGPKLKELKSYEEASSLLSEAKRILPKTKIGVSVLSTDKEDFEDLKQKCASADFWELNLKYSMRSMQVNASFFETIADKWQETLDSVDRFLKAFPNLPVFIKIPRELEWLPGTKQAIDLLDKLKCHGDAGLIVANSRKMDVQPFIHQDEERNLTGGVMTGDLLFDSTLTMIKGLKNDCAERDISIVATGGMVDERQVLMAMRAGAVAVQLCTAFDYNGSVFYSTLL